MKKSRYTSEQISFALKQAETGTRVSEVCRKLGISEATFYNWKAKYASMTVSDARRLKELEVFVLHCRKTFLLQLNIPYQGD